MAKFQGTQNKGFSLVEEGVQVFKIMDAKYNEANASVCVTMVTKDGSRLYNYINLVKKDGELNKTMVNSAIMLVNTVLGIKDNELDTDLLPKLVNKYVYAEVYHDDYTGTVRAKVRPFSYELAYGFDSEPTDNSIGGDLDEL